MTEAAAELSTDAVSEPPASRKSAAARRLQFIQDSESLKPPVSYDALSDERPSTELGGKFPLILACEGESLCCLGREEASVRALAERLVAEHERALKEIASLRRQLAGMARGTEKVVQSPGTTPSRSSLRRAQSATTALEGPADMHAVGSDSWGIATERTSSATVGRASTGDGGQVGGIELHKVWLEILLIENQEDSVNSGDGRRSSVNSAVSSVVSGPQNRVRYSIHAALAQGVSLKAKQKARCSIENLISPPGGRFRVPWDMLGMIVIFWEAVLLPMSVFNLQQSVFLTITAWITRIFWTCDLPATFFVGYFVDGALVTVPTKIARRYFRTTFLLDLSLVVIDWVEAAGNSNLQALKIFRLVRYVRLMRLFKLKRILRWIQDALNSEYSFLVFDFLKMILFTLMISHVSACLFWAIGGTASVDNWINDNELAGKPVLLQYTFSLYWSVAMFLLQTTITPTNPGELIYCVILLCLGLVLFSSIISRITALILQINSIHRAPAQEMWKMRRFFLQNKVPVELSRRVVRYVEYYLESISQEVSWSDVPLLQKITPVLRTELHYVSFMQTWRQHALFGFIENISDVTMHRISARALSEVALAERDPLFFQGDVATSMQAVSKGKLLYVQKKGGADSSRSQKFLIYEVMKAELEAIEAAAIEFAGADGDGTSAPMTSSTQGRQQAFAGTFLAEGTLWMKWKHRGDAYAMTECCVMSCDAQLFAETATLSTFVHRQLVSYAAMWARTMQKASYLHTTTDIVSKDEVDELVRESRHSGHSHSEHSEGEGPLPGEGCHTLRSDGSTPVHASFSQRIAGNLSSFIRTVSPTD